MEREGDGNGYGSVPLSMPSKFTVYQNPVLSAALTAGSIRPSKFTFIIFSLSSFSAVAFLSRISRENGLNETVRIGILSQQTNYVFSRAIQALLVTVLVGSTVVLFKAIYLHRAAIPPCRETKGRPCLNRYQMKLLGIKPEVEDDVPESEKKFPLDGSIFYASSVLAPVHHSTTSFNEKLSAGTSNPLFSYANPSKSIGSPSTLYPGSGKKSPLLTSPEMDSGLSTPWSGRLASSKKDMTEEQLEFFLAQVDEKIIESAEKYSTPPPMATGFGVLGSNTSASSISTSGTTRSTPLWPVRMSPSSQKLTPPKKGEGEYPMPMSVEESIEGFRYLGIYPQIEEWRDRLRQWFSLILLNPLRHKIETSHIQVMQAAAKLGIQITISQMGSKESNGESSVDVSSIDRKQWQLPFNLVELYKANYQLFQPQNPMDHLVQELRVAATEHQKLDAVLKGEFASGLLPHINIREDHMVRRIQELAEGTCVKNYECFESRESCSRFNGNKALELPLDSHLLMYLFCAFLEYPCWMPRVEPCAEPCSSQNPLYLGCLPPKDKSHEKYIAIISSAPFIIHPQACILVVGKQSPPIFSLYWNNKLQFCLQGRTALWDSILLFCHRIKIAYGCVIRGIHLGSRALSILPVLDFDSED